jgi:hypothetical protein
MEGGREAVLQEAVTRARASVDEAVKMVAAETVAGQEAVWQEVVYAGVPTAVVGWVASSEAVWEVVEVGASHCSTLRNHIPGWRIARSQGTGARRSRRRWCYWQTLWRDAEGSGRHSRSPSRTL